MSDRPIRSATAALLVVAICLILSSGVASAQSGSEQEILRRIKEDVFEERWDSVLAGADQLIATYPESTGLARTMYYRARALMKLPGKEAEAMDAWTKFIDRFPSETLLREDALISRMGLAKSMYLNGKKETIRTLVVGLREKGYARIYAAIQISYLDYVPGRKDALPILQECASKESDAEVRNECTLGILRIDPKRLDSVQPPLPPSPPGQLAPLSPPAPPQPPGAEPKLIRLQVREKGTDKITVAVNLPVAFAEALLGSLSEMDQGAVMEELKTRHIDINNLWKSLRTLGKQTLVEIETEEAYIKVWLE